MTFRLNRAVAGTAIGCVLVVLATAALACSDDDDGGDAKTPDAATAVATAAVTAAPAPEGATTFHVMAGHREGNIDVEMFMPADIRVRVGDSIEWTAFGFEGHTVTFGDDDDTLAGIGPYLLPNPEDPSENMFSPVLAFASDAQGPVANHLTFINSGFIGVPAAQTYKLTFAEEGLYTYLCLVHPFTMTGTVSVEPASTPVDSPEAVASQGEAELASYLEELGGHAREARDLTRTAPGPDGSTTHYVQVGLITDHGQVAVYTPGNLEIAPGDTVIFQNDDRNFHNVIFKGDDPELPPGIGFLTDESGGVNFTLDNASAVAVDPPPDGFDETTFLSSGSMGVLQPRLTWTVRFDNPGTYVYACTIHGLAGMTGAIEVFER